jgi:ATP-dependent Lhr-like helicase
MARARLLLDRYGVVSREVVNAEQLGSFAELYPVLKAMEEAGKLRRGYFVAGMGGAQFASPGADERLRRPPEDAPALVLAATDPANPYGGALPWPAREPRPQRTPGALVVLYRGKLLAYLSRGEQALTLFSSDEEPERSHELVALTLALKSLLGPSKRRALMLQSINGEDAQRSPFVASFLAAGFHASAGGVGLRRADLPLEEPLDEDESDA